MTRRKLTKLIDEATELGKQNANKHRYLNWCKHLQINLKFPSELGQMTGLPIGPHEIHCPYFHGSEGVSVETIATSFIQSHCANCQYHEEVDPDNLGKLIVEKVRHRQNQPDPAALLRQQLRQLAQVEDPAKILQNNVSSDKELNGLIILFDESKHKNEAAEKVLAAAHDLGSHLFSAEAIRVLTTYLSDEDIGTLVVDILRAVCEKDKTHFDIALEPAKLAYTNYKQREALTYFFGDYVKARSSIAGVNELLSKFVTQHSISMETIFSHRPSEGALYVLRAIAQVDAKELGRLFKNYLDVGDNAGRLAVCNTLEFLLEAAPELGDGLLEPLLQSLRLEEDPYGSSADGKTIATVARILRSNTEKYLPRVESHYSSASHDVKGLILRIYRNLLQEETCIGIHRSIIERAISDLVSGTENVDLLEANADYLEATSRHRPELLEDKIDSLLGVMSLATERIAQKPGRLIRLDITEQHDPSWYQKWQTIFGKLSKTLEHVGREQPAKVASALREVIQGLLPKGKQVDTLVASLIKMLGSLCKTSIEATQASIPQLFGLVVHQSPIIQSAAVDAFGEISIYHGNVLPADILELFKQLVCLNESNSALLKSLFDYFCHLDTIDAAYAKIVLPALFTWEQSVNSNSLKQCCIDAIQHVSSNFSAFRISASKMLWKYCYHADNYVRKDNIKAWRRLSEKYPSEYSMERLVLASVHYYRDFIEEISDFNGVHEPFESLFDVQRQFFMPHIKEIMQVAQSQRPEVTKNKLNFATLLMLNEYYAEAAKLYDAYLSSLGSEPRFEEPKRRLSLLVEINKAEAAFVLDLSADGQRHLESAVRHVVESANSIQGNSFQSAEQRADEEQFLWQQVRLRERWIRALHNFKLSAARQVASELSAIESEYDSLFRKFDNKVHEIDESVVDAIKQLIAATKLVLDWVTATLQADASASRFLEAARNGLDVAVESAKKGAYFLFLEQLMNKGKLIDEIKRASDVPNFIKALSTIPVPHINDYHTRDRWGGFRKGQERFFRSQNLSPSEPAYQVKARELIVGEIEILIDGQKPDKELIIQTGMMYGVQLTLRLPRWPEEYHRVRFFALTTSQLPGHLPQAEIEKPAKLTDSLVCETHILFQYPLSDKAPAINIKLAARFIDQVGHEHKVDLFGDTQLTLRVRERQQSPSQTITINNAQAVVVGDNTTVNQLTGRPEDKVKK